VKVEYDRVIAAETAISGPDGRSFERLDTGSPAARVLVKDETGYILRDHGIGMITKACTAYDRPKPSRSRPTGDREG
jgi:hypothetical protein